MLAGVKEAGLSGCPGTVCWAWASLTCMEEEGEEESCREPGGREADSGEGPQLGHSLWDVNSERLAAGSLWDNSLIFWVPRGG